MNLILLDERDRVNGDVFRLSDERARHVREVLRAEPGRALRVGLLEGPLGTGTVEAAASAPEGADAAAVVDVRLSCVFEGAPPPRPLTDLVLAVPRPKSLAKLLPEATALGLDRLLLLRTWRVEKPYLASGLVTSSDERLPLLRDGLMQARDTRLPEVLVEPLFKPWVEDRATAFIEGRRAFVAHPQADLDLARQRLGPGEKAVIAIGPEGGFTLYEVSALVKAGFTPVSLGTRILRVETAVTAALSTLDVLRRQCNLEA